MSAIEISPMMRRVRDAVIAVVDGADGGVFENRPLPHNRRAKKLAMYVARDRLGCSIEEIADACESTRNSTAVRLSVLRSSDRTRTPYVRSGGAAVSFDAAVDQIVERINSEDTRRLEASATGREASA